MEGYSRYLDCCQNDRPEYQEVFFSQGELSAISARTHGYFPWNSFDSLPDSVRRARQTAGSPFHSAATCASQQVKRTFKR